MEWEAVGRVDRRLWDTQAAKAGVAVADRCPWDRWVAKGEVGVVDKWGRYPRGCPAAWEAVARVDGCL